MLPPVLTTSHARVQLLQVSPKMYTVTHVWVHQPYRRQGWGTIAMRNLVRQADILGAVLVLQIDPDPGALSATQLLAWYRRHGFKVWDDHAHSENRDEEQPLIRFPQAD